MSNIEKLERSTKEMQERIKFFEACAKKKGMDVTREGKAPAGYWYTAQETNTAFYWFLSGISYN